MSDCYRAQCSQWVTMLFVISWGGAAVVSQGEPVKAWVSLTAEQRGEVEASLRGRVAGLVAGYMLWDLGTNEGRGRSEQKTSGGLGWGESTFLRNYMLCYHATGDTYWLDKVQDHFDRMLGNMSDPDEDGFRAWSSMTYSVGIVRARVTAGAETLTVSPELQRPYVKRGGEKVTGHRYGISFSQAAELVVTDETAKSELLREKYDGKATLTAIPGAKLTVEGKAGPGARIEVTTTAPQWIEYVVHDGMVTYPVAQWIEAVYREPRLHEKYKAKADEYVRILDHDFRQKWEQYWVDLPDGAGLYTFTRHETERFPLYSLPHNQYLALARTWCVLQDLPGVPHREMYRDKAERMAKYFRRNLRRVGEAYEWNYWDPRPGEDLKPHIEDSSHGTIDISFAVEAASRGIVFTEEDLRRLARTYLGLMWNGSLEDPLFGGRVNTQEGGKRVWWEWIGLARADFQVWRVAWALFQKQGESVSMAPTMAALYEDLVGVSEQERREAVRVGAQVRKAMTTGPLLNGSFELGLPGVRSPLGWALTTWNPDEGSHGEWVQEGRDGGKAVALIGGEGKVNVLAQPTRWTKVKPKSVLKIGVWYRSEGASKPYLSVLGRSEEGERLQYDSCSALPAAQDWQHRVWEVAAKAGVAEVQVLLRNGGTGKVLYDDVTLELARAQ